MLILRGAGSACLTNYYYLLNWSEIVATRVINNYFQNIQIVRPIIYKNKFFQNCVSERFKILHIL